MYKYNDYELLYLIQEMDDEALDIMLKKYIPLIKARIKAFRIKKSSQEDFLQEGLLVLNKAIQRFNPDSKKTFTRYFDMILQRQFIRSSGRNGTAFTTSISSARRLTGSGAGRSTSGIAGERPRRLFVQRFRESGPSYLKNGYKPREVAAFLNCPVKRVYDANDRIRRKTRAAKKFLDKDGGFC